MGAPNINDEDLSEVAVRADEEGTVFVPAGAVAVLGARPGRRVRFLLRGRDRASGRAELDAMFARLADHQADRHLTDEEIDAASGGVWLSTK